MWHSGLKNKLEKAVGKGSVLSLPEQLGRYNVGGRGCTPRFVCLPKTTTQVSKIVQAAIENEMAVVTEIEDGTTPAHPALLKKFIYVDLSGMGKIVEIDPANTRTVVQPAVVMAALKRELEPHGLRIPDAQTGNATIIREVSFRKVVSGIVVVLPGGRIAKLEAKAESAGYCMIELFLKSNSTLGIITEITLDFSRWRDFAALSIAPDEGDEASEAPLWSGIENRVNPLSSLNPQNILPPDSDHRRG